MFVLSSVWFNGKVREFDNLSRLNDFLDVRVPRIATAHKLSEAEVREKLEIVEFEGLNIGAGSQYPSNDLSNFANHDFEIDGVSCASMEGFVQALKVSDVRIQVQICNLVGREAKLAGSEYHWKQNQVLYWQGVCYARDSQEYTNLITRAYDELFKNKQFKQALKDSGKALLFHTMGRNRKSETVLTKQEFIGQLNRLRSQL